MQRDVRIKLSAGLLVIAVIHAAMLAVLFAVLHIEVEKPQAFDLAPAEPPPGQTISDFRGDSIQLPPVNVSARDEIKQQTANCPSCVPAPSVSGTWPGSVQAQQWANYYRANLVTVRQLNANSIMVYARLPAGSVWVATGKDVTLSYSGSNCYLALIDAMRRGVQANSPTPAPPLPPGPPINNPAIAPTVGENQSKHQIALFVSSDAKSQQLLQWFETDPALVELRGKVDFQVYTPDNALYRARYAAQVPVAQFPAMLFLKPDGGHIHAAGANMLPPTPAQLLSDIRSSYELSKSAEPQPTGLIREAGYSWDAAITPQMQLQSEDCPDGWCPDVTPQRPRIVDRLFDQSDKNREALFGGWLSLTELVAVLVIGVGGLLLAFLIVVIAIIKRR